MTPRSDIAYENRQVLALVQALLGAISPNTRAVSLECRGTAVRLHFLLQRDSPEDREEIDDIAFDFEALQERPIEVAVVIVVSAEPLATALVHLPGRRVFIRREGQTPGA